MSDQSDLLEELRHHEREYPSLVHGPLCGRAADEIASIITQVSYLKNAHVFALTEIAKLREAIMIGAAEVVSLRAQLASERKEVAGEIERLRQLLDRTTSESLRVHTQLASARKALDAANEYFEDAATSSAYSRRVVKEIRAAYTTLTDEEGT